MIDHIAELNAQALDIISDCTTKEELMEKLINNKENDGGLAAMFASTAGDAKLNKATNPEYDPESPLGPESTEAQTPDTSGSSPYTVYYSWLTTYGYLFEAGEED